MTAREPFRGDQGRSDDDIEDDGEGPVGLLGGRASRIPAISETMRDERRPLPPADLVQDRQDGPHPAIRGGKRIKTMLLRRRPQGRRVSAAEAARLLLEVLS